MRYTPPRDDVMFSARIPRPLAEQAHQYARQHRCSLSTVLREALALWLAEEHVPGRGPAPETDDPLDSVTLKALVDAAVRAYLEERPVPDPVPVHVAIQKAYTPAPVPAGDAPDYDATQYQLGTLCARQHAYGLTGATLRRRKDGSCPACAVERQHASRAKKRATAQA